MDNLDQIIENINGYTEELRRIDEQIGDRMSLIEMVIKAMGVGDEMQVLRRRD